MAGGPSICGLVSADDTAGLTRYAHAMGVGGGAVVLTVDYGVWSSRLEAGEHILQFLDEFWVEDALLEGFLQQLN
jgi:hypothetical protein